MICPGWRYSRIDWLSFTTTQASVRLLLMLDNVRIGWAPVNWEKSPNGESLRSKTAPSLGLLSCPSCWHDRFS